MFTRNGSRPRLVFPDCRQHCRPSSWKDRPPGVKKLRWRERWLLWSHGNSAERQLFAIACSIKTLSSGSPPVHALSLFCLGRPGTDWPVSGRGASGNITRSSLTPAYLLTGLVLNLMLKAWVAAEAGRQLAEDRKLGALELSFHPDDHPRYTAWSIARAATSISRSATSGAGDHLCVHVGALCGNRTRKTCEASCDCSALEGW